MAGNIGLEQQRYFFTLIDEQGKIIEDFNPHTTNGLMSWSSDSQYLGVLIGEVSVGYLIMNLSQHTFALIKFKRKPPVIVSHEQGAITFTMSDHFVHILNTETLIGGGISEIPRAKYERSRDLKIKLVDLVFHHKDSMKDIFDLHKDDQAYAMGPVQNGFWPFDGRRPQNTIDGFNGRPFEVYQLKAFANFGDEQSQKWMAEIDQMTEGKYNRFLQVSYYLGERQKEL